MTPKLTDIVLLHADLKGRRYFKVSFDNDRHHASRFFEGDRDAVAYTLIELGKALLKDKKLDPQ